MWITIDNTHYPKAGQKVVGLWKDDAKLYWRNAEGQYIDAFHGCYCYCPPIYYAELPQDL